MAINVGSELNPGYMQSTHALNDTSGVSSVEMVVSRDIAGELKSGQILSGEVVNVDGNQIEIKLSDSGLLKARLDAGINILKGQTVSFEVNKGSGNVTLRPLYANLSANPSVTNALKEASMPLTNTNMRMVSTMMEEGMSVNKNALWDMFRSVSHNPEVSVESAVQLTKLNLPIDEITAGQLENYKNFEHQIIKDVTNLTDGIVSLYEDGLNNDKGDYSLAASALELINTGEGVEGRELFEALTKGIGDNSVNVGDGSAEFLSDLKQLMGAEGVDIGDAKELLPEAVNTDGVATNRIVTGEITPGEITAGEISPGEITPGEVTTDVATRDTQLPAEEVFEREESVLSRSEREKIADSFEALGIDEKTAEGIRDGSVSDKTLTVFAKEYVKALNEDTLPDTFSPKIKDEINKMLSSPLFKKVIGSEYSGQFVLKPKEVAEDGKIEELYRRILEQSKAAITTLSNAGRESSTAVMSANNMTDNVNFMNQLNQMLAYVQLPLRMNNENAHGDLYVYTRKKKLINNDGNVSALLHLDMENLGPMDVYVALRGEKVNTHFYMQDEKLLDFIEANIDILNDRLTKKGYDMTTTVTTKDAAEEPVSMAEEFLRPEEGMVNSTLSKLSFDVRA